MQENTEQAEARRAAVSDVAEGFFLGLVEQLISGKSRLVVVSDPYFVLRAGEMAGGAEMTTQLVAYRHTIEVESLTPPG